jgi:hypothetical protein
MKSKTTKAAGKASLDSLVGKRGMVHRKINGQHVEVILMAVSGIWAMVRHPRFMPFICEVDEIVANNAFDPVSGQTIDGIPTKIPIPLGKVVHIEMTTPVEVTMDKTDKKGETRR